MSNCLAPYSSSSAAASTTSKGEAVQIISFVPKQQLDPQHPSSSSKGLKLDAFALRELTRKIEDFLVAVIVIAGAGRGGKSFILSYFVRYLTALERSRNGTACQDDNGLEAGTDVEDWMEMDNPNISMKDWGFKFQVCTYFTKSINTNFFKYVNGKDFIIFKSHFSSIIGILIPHSMLHMINVIIIINNWK